MSTACSTSSMIRLSVISRSKYLASSPLFRRALTTRATKLLSLNCRGDTFTQTVIGGRPASCQALFCRQASCSTQSPIGTIRPVSSAIGMKSIGGTTPRSRAIPADQRFDREDAPRPQVDLRLIVQDESSKQGHVFAVEALIRWNRPTVGVVPPIDSHCRSRGDGPDQWRLGVVKPVGRTRPGGAPAAAD